MNRDDLNIDKTNKTKRNITILGDSMSKDINSYKMRQDLTANDRIYIKSFPGATVGCMKDYSKPSLEFKRDVILLH